MVARVMIAVARAFIGSKLLHWALGIVFGTAIVLSSCTVAATTPLVSGNARVAAPVQPAALTAPRAVPTLAPLALPTFSPLPPAPVQAVDNSRVEGFIAAAAAFLGTPYDWGGCSHRGIDCSCLVMLGLAAVGIASPRVTTAQVLWGTPIPDKRRGAMLFFNDTCVDCGANPTHVGISLGDGRMLHAGDPVQIVSIDTPYWRAHFRSAGWPPGL